MAKITFIGDSVTEYNFRAKYNYAKYFEQDGYEVQNLGISKTGFYRVDPYKNRIEKIDDDTDIIAVAITFNDLNEDVDIEIGDFDELDENTVFGYIDEFFTTLIEKYPTKPIIAYIQNPWATFRYGNDLSDEYIGSVMEYLAQKGIPFYTDMYFLGSVLRPWNEENAKKYFVSDNDEIGDVGTLNDIHPNSLGHKVIYKYLKKVIEENLILE